MNVSPFMKDIKSILKQEGVVVLADAWFAGGFASKTKCITNPESAKGQVTRAGGSMYEEMLKGAGASIASMPSNEIYQGLQSGVLNSVNTSSESFVTFKIFEQVKCITPPGKFALWFMYQPILMSQKSFDKLNEIYQLNEITHNIEQLKNIVTNFISNPNFNPKTIILNWEEPASILKKSFYKQTNSIWTEDRLSILFGYINEISNTQSEESIEHLLDSLSSFMDYIDYIVVKLISDLHLLR